MAEFEPPEKRLDTRKDWRSKIVFEDEFGCGLLYLYSKDISLGGLFLEEPPPLKLGAHLLLSFVLPGKKRPIKITGEVVRFIEHEMEGEPALRKGVGIRFVDVDPESRKQLSSFIFSSRAP